MGWQDRLPNSSAEFSPRQNGTGRSHSRLTSLNPLSLREERSARKSCRRATWHWSNLERTGICLGRRRDGKWSTLSMISPPRHLRCAGRELRGFLLPSAIGAELAESRAILRFIKKRAKSDQKVVARGVAVTFSGRALE